MLLKDENLVFLRKKVDEIKLAVFKAEMDSVLQIPNSVISTIKTDDEGNIWFYTSCNSNYKKSIENFFYGYLDYYQKAKNYRLRISGKASVVNDDENYARPQNNTISSYILIKLKILHAEYFESKKYVISLSFRGKVKNFFSNIFFPESNKIFNFSDDINFIH